MRAAGRRRLGALLVLFVGSALTPGATRAAARPAPASSAGLSLEQVELPAQTVVYYNARVAQREGRYEDVLKLWLVRNALVEEGHEPIHDGDFRSLLWAALAGEGLCHDGIRADEEGAGVGLWPLALHNWVSRSSSKQPPMDQPRTFSSFDTGFQQRRFSLQDVLSVEELKGARFYKTTCFRPWLELPFLDTPHWLDLDDRLSTGLVMRDLLHKAQETLKHERVRGHVVIETRLFDLEVALVRLAKAAARRETGLLGQVARATGVSEPALTLVREKRLARVRAGRYAALLRRSFTWSTLDWFSLSRNRRLALFAEATETYAAEERARPAIERTMLQNIDALVERGEGGELSQWIGFVTYGQAADLPEGQAEAIRARLVDELALGERGERLLALEPETGFTERAVIALRRGTHDLERGRSLDAMRSFSLAMDRAGESTRSSEVHNLAKRWFAYVLAQHRADDEALALLEAFVDPLARNELLEVLLWRAAFHADVASFDKVAAGVRRGGSLDVRVAQLKELAEGDAGALWRRAREDYAERPHALYKLTKRLTEELATESLDVRRSNRVTLELGMALLEETREGAHRGLQRRIGEQLRRMQALLDGIDRFDESAGGRAQAAAPGAEAYAGSVRLAPADPLPWPFAFPRVKAPSPFSPIELTPVEWIDEDGRRVFGWHLHED